MVPTRPLLLIVIATVLAPGLTAAMDLSIAVSSTAVADYLRPKEPAGGFKPESYVFAQGQFFGGGTVDHSLEKTTFADVAKTLAVNLAKQNYFPARTAAEADLLIMVHWGSTLIYEDPQKDFVLQGAQDALGAFNAAQAANGLADPSALNQQLETMSMEREGVMDAVHRNAVLLGYERALQRESKGMEASNEEISMINELSEERYFVILMAYDNHLRTKEHKSKLLWVTRLSVRSPGNNFTESLPTLAKVGADVFGQQHDNLVRVKTRRENVKLEEMQVIGTVDSPPPAKADKPAK